MGIISHETPTKSVDLDQVKDLEDRDETQHTGGERDRESKKAGNVERGGQLVQDDREDDRQNDQDQDALGTLDVRVDRRGYGNTPQPSARNHARNSRDSCALEEAIGQAKPAGPSIYPYAWL